MNLKYSIGQWVWRPTFESSPAYVVCPDCGGTGRIRCILHDGAEHSIECEGCRRGYDPPSGRLQVYARAPRAVFEQIIGFEATDGKVEYQTEGCYRIAEDDLCDSEPAAIVAAAKKAEAENRAERERIAAKEKPAKSWSWHVHYHRRCIREAERQIAYHMSKLNVAAIKAKEPS